MNGADHLHTLFFFRGYIRSGMVKLEDVVAVHSASRVDPTNPGGQLGTRALRHSLDEHNASMSFSIISHHSLMPGQVETLDIECLNDVDYYILMGGFYVLRQQVAQRKADVKRKEKEKLGLSKENMFKFVKSQSNDNIDSVEGESSVASKKKLKDDPLEAMYYNNDPGHKSYRPSRYETFEEFISNQSNLLTPPAQFLGWKTKGTQIWCRLCLAGLEVKPVFSWDLKKVILKIKCPNWRLEEVAERMHIRLRLRTGGYKRFKIAQRELYVTNPFDGSIFRSSDRQRIIDFIIRSKIKDGGAGLDDSTSLGKAICQRFPLHMKSRIFEFKYSWLYFWKVERPGEVAAPWSIFSVGPHVTISRLYHGVKNFFSGALDQPLDQIAEYFGESVAFYFAWLAFCTRWLILPGFLGLLVFSIQIWSHRLDHWVCIPYAVFIMVWSSMMLAYWRQKSSALAYRWGVLGLESDETERPEFFGQSAYDSTTGETIKVYSPWKRLLKYFVSAPIMLLYTSLILLFVVAILYSQDEMAKDYVEGKSLSYVPRFDVWNFRRDNDIAEEDDDSTQIEWKIDYVMAILYYPSMYGLVEGITAQFANYMAFKLTQYENHRLESTFLNRLILKIIACRFWAIFTPALYYAFFLNDSEDAYLRMSLTCFGMMTFGNWWTKFLECIIPYWTHQFKRYRMTSSVAKTNKLIWAVRLMTARSTSGASDSDEVEEGNLRDTLVSRREKYLEDAKSECWSEALRNDYSSTEDYTEMTLQLGFTLLFGAVFPLAPFISLMNNLFYIRIDAAKLMYTRKRPIAQKLGGMGAWEDIIQVMSVMGIIITCCMLAFTSEVLSNLMYFAGTGFIVVVLFFFEHIILMFKYILMTSVNRIPLSVRRDQERNKLKSQEARRKRIVKRLSLDVGDEFANDFEFDHDESDGQCLKDYVNNVPFGSNKGKNEDRRCSRTSLNMQARQFIKQESFSSVASGLTQELNEQNAMAAAWQKKSHVPFRKSSGRTSYLDETNENHNSSMRRRSSNGLATDPFTFASSMVDNNDTSNSMLANLYKYATSAKSSFETEEKEVRSYQSRDLSFQNSKEYALRKMYSSSSEEEGEFLSSDDEEQLVEPRSLFQKVKSSRNITLMSGPGPARKYGNYALKQMSKDPKRTSPPRLARISSNQEMNNDEEKRNPDDEKNDNVQEYENDQEESEKDLCESNHEGIEDGEDEDDDWTIDPNINIQCNANPSAQYHDESVVSNSRDDATHSSREIVRLSSVSSLSGPSFPDDFNSTDTNKEPVSNNNDLIFDFNAHSSQEKRPSIVKSSGGKYTELEQNIEYCGITLSRQSPPNLAGSARLSSHVRSTRQDVATAINFIQSQKNLSPNTFTGEKDHSRTSTPYQTPESLPPLGNQSKQRRDSEYEASPQSTSPNAPKPYIPRRSIRGSFQLRSLDTQLPPTERSEFSIVNDHVYRNQSDYNAEEGTYSSSASDLISRALHDNAMAQALKQANKESKGEMYFHQQQQQLPPRTPKKQSRHNENSINEKNNENSVPSNTRTPNMKKKNKPVHTPVSETNLTPRGEIAYKKHLDRLNSSHRTPATEEKQVEKKKKKKKPENTEVDEAPSSPRRQLSPKTKSLKSQFISWLRDENQSTDPPSKPSDGSNPFSDIVK